jgi:RNA polymerase sigma factor (sigma-70 family)
METHTMSLITKNGPLVRDRAAPPKRARQRAARLMAKPPSRRCRLWLEQLENRVTPSVLGIFELDGNTTTGVLAPAAYDLDMTQLEDEQVVELAQQCGYLPARNELICRFVGLAEYLVGRYASRNGLQEADSQDAQQDAVLWILEAIERYRTDESAKPDGCHFRSFLHRVIASRLVDFHRYLRLRNHSSLAGGVVSRPDRDSDRRRDEEDTALDVPDPDPNSLKCVEVDEVQVRLHQELARLGEADRGLWNLLAAGTSLRQAAAALTISYDAAKRRRRKLLARLKSSLTK